ncbi:hypothetical protein IFM89_014890 [Coptis chinensis]|uniref:POX domain-containing protein n=1 Tax=Coptis chinensis TaxID=261450 RepID=A0A835LJD9_9MAGN|nr:hypothetical protein IFM89_014890 [Coptis chinensis]
MSERFHSGYLNSATSFENSVVEDINIFRPESHVAQQRRRDKLRNNQQIVSTTDHLQDIHNHLLQFPNHCRVNADPATLTGERNSDLVYDTAMFSSEMLNFPMPRHPLYARFKDSVCSQETGGDHQSGRLVGLDDASLGSSSHVVSSRLAPSARVPHYTGYWKGVGPAQQSSDWIVNYVSQAGENACSQNPLLVGECLPSTMKEPNLSSSSNYMKSGCNAYQDVNMASASTSQVYQKQCGDLNFNSTLHNALQTDNPRNLGSQGCEMARLVQQNMRGAGNSSWLDGESDSDIRPTYENVVHASRLCDPDRSMYRSVEGGSGKLGMGTNKSRLDGDNFVGDPSSRGLSLSLSSHPSPTVTVAHFGENFESENLLSRSGVIFNGLQDSKSNNSGQLYSYSKASVICNGEGNSVQGGVASSAYTRRNIGPLGPFTGYATILKNSKFLKPAQQLLDEICLVNGSKHKKMSELSETGSREMSISSNAINLEDDACGKGGTSGFSSTSFNSSNEAVGEGGSGTGSSQPHRPRIQQKKAKLLFMQEEVILYNFIC